MTWPSSRGSLAAMRRGILRLFAVFFIHWAVGGVWAVAVGSEKWEVEEKTRAKRSETGVLSAFIFFTAYCLLPTAHCLLPLQSV